MEGHDLGLTGLGNPVDNRQTPWESDAVLNDIPSIFPAGFVLHFAILDKMTPIKALTEEWQALLARSNCNRAFSSPAWFAAAVAAVPPDACHVAVARRQGVLCGLLPLVTRSGRAVFPGKLADYQDLITATDDKETAQKLLTFVLDSIGTPIDFSFCRADSSIVTAMARLHSGWSFTTAAARTGCCHIDLSGDFDSYLATRSYMFRQHLRRAIRKAQRDGLLVCELTPDHLHPDHLPDLFLSLHFESMGEDSCFQRPHHEAFVRALLPALFRQRRLRVMGLVRGAEQLGIDLYMVGPSSIGTWNAGFRAEVNRWSPGKLMLSHAIQTGFNEGLAQVDMLRGLQPWKLGWATGQHEFGRFST